jgi:hypothetical protein
VNNDSINTDDPVLTSIVSGAIGDAVPIVAGSGTGGYRGMAGTFAMTLTLNEVHSSPCATSLSILRQVIVLSGTGKITKR